MQFKDIDVALEILPNTKYKTFIDRKQYSNMYDHFPLTNHIIARKLLRFQIGIIVNIQTL